MRNLNPCDPHTTFWDEAVPNFGIRVGKNSKTWIVLKGSTARQRISIGRYPAMSLADARTAAKRLLLEPYERQTTIAFSDARRLFLETHYRHRRESTRKEARRLLEKHATFTCDLADLTDVEISKALDRIAAPSEKLHFFRALRTMLRWATRPPRRFIKYSPLDGYEAPSKEVARDRVLSEEELKAVWRAAEGTFGPIVKLLIITGQRKSQIGCLHSDWLASDGILFPASIMKTAREHLIPLTPLAASFIPPDRKGCLFPARHKDTPFAGYAVSTESLRRRSGVEFRLHDLRRTAATFWAGKLKVQPHVIQSLLAHSWGGVTARYNRFDYFDEKRAALLAWEHWLEQLLAKA